MEKSYKFHIGLHVDGAINSLCEVQERKDAAIAIMKRNCPDGFTVTDTNGYWINAIEPGLVVEVIANDFDYDTVARFIRMTLNQICVLVTISKPEVYWIVEG
jgi:hypothetical protein